MGHKDGNVSITSTDELVRFRHRFKMAVQFAVAARVGNMIQVAGHLEQGDSELDLLEHSCF